ncbi:MAG: hypothetical protein F9K23_17025 [Bacteroidetes bacterium]|nr:MAG: hypothetical protein F9K23_17025 [Bacteroidota bacterium]
MDNKGFVISIAKRLHSGERLTNKEVNTLAGQFGITDKNLIKELTELALVGIARRLAHQKGVTEKETFDIIVSLYQRQNNLSHRTSHSILWQQYSTPAPIAYLMGHYCGIHKKGNYLEPSAGNGMLTIAGQPEHFTVNEIDPVRLQNLAQENYKEIYRLDAEEWVLPQVYDAVLTNPPFGTLPAPVKREGYIIYDLDHLLAINALAAMKDNGKAAIIIGGHTRWDSYGRVQAGKNRIFLNFLYHFYHVEDILLINGKALYSRQGTGFNSRLLLINGRKAQPQGVAPLKKPTDTVINTFDELYHRITQLQLSDSVMHSKDEALRLNEQAKKIKLLLDNGLGMPYIPASKNKRLNVDTPDSMGAEMQQALELLKQAVGNVDEFVRKKLGYKTTQELNNALSAEQTDAVALSIFNVENRNQGIIIGDQTGIGKGRVAAAMIRYAVKHGKQPVFITEKPNLFSDLYRDLSAIGSASLNPFILNTKESKTQVKDEDGKVVYEPPLAQEQNKIIASGKLPPKFDYVMLTYSQLNGGEINYTGTTSHLKLSAKQQFIRAFAPDNVFIMDEAHNASGESKTGIMLQHIIDPTISVIFLSATFAKRPDNLPIYALKTAISEANMTKQALVDGIEKGGIALQEILSSQLVEYGQMLRRERTYEGIEVNYITLDDKADEHRAIADNITEILRAIIAFQLTYVQPEIYKMDMIAALSNTGTEIETRKGTESAGVDNTPYFSKIFQVVNQMLFSIKAGDVADRAIMRLKEGKKPVIAFSSTMGSFLESMQEADGTGIKEGSRINADFATVLMKGLDGILRYSERTVTGEVNYKKLDISVFSFEAQREYNKIAERIRTITSGIVISPIDLIKQKIQAAGYSVAEVTGRKYELQLTPAKANEALPEVQFENNAKSNGKALKLSDLNANLKKLMPQNQQRAIMGNDELSEVVAQLNQLADNARSNYRKNNDTAFLHYFFGGSDWYINGFDGEDLLYGFAVLNGDWESAEYGYTSLEELLSIKKGFSTVELDFYWQPVEIKQIIKNEGHHGLNGLGKVPTATTAKPNTAIRYIGTVVARKRENTNDAFRRFNDNEADVLLINQSGSTGASAHALPTKKVPPSQVKQRVMLLLQAELNISTEVQKRGRINRTGQILPPIYDYVFSAIPAEKRLMMMLQNKLKSLDANTSSNQRQSAAMLSTDDFLNRIGDNVVVQYLRDNRKINELLDDPMKLAKLATDKRYTTEDAAHKVTGRVAVLSAQMQEGFYKDVLAAYEEEVAYLKQIDEYDLEVEYVDLKAVTLERKIMIVGKGGKSAFGNNTYIEKCEVNILKKPYTVSELDNLYAQATNGKTPHEIKSTLREKYSQWVEQETERLTQEINDEYDTKIAMLPPQGDYQTLYRQLQEARKLKLANVVGGLKNQSATVLKMLSFFHIGRLLEYPIDPYDPKSGNSVAVSLGVAVNENAAKPYLPSKMVLQLAIASGRKRINIPLSKYSDIAAIIGRSNDTRQGDWEYTKSNWQIAIKSATLERGIAYIATGNLLQSYSENNSGKGLLNKGRLITFTTREGKVRKGKIMPYGWEAPDFTGSEKIIKVPLLKALPIIASLPPSGGIETDMGVSLFKKRNYNYQLQIHASRKISGEVFLDQDLNRLMENGRFDKQAEYMIAEFSTNKLKEVLTLLQERFKASVFIAPHQLDLIAGEIEADKGSDEVKPLKRMQQVNEPESDPEFDYSELEALRLRARAIKIKLLLAI